MKTVRTCSMITQKLSVGVNESTVSPPALSKVTGRCCPLQTSKVDICLISPGGVCCEGDATSGLVHRDLRTCHLHTQHLHSLQFEPYEESAHFLRWPGKVG